MRRPGGESLSFFLPSPFVLIEFKMDVTDQLIVTKEFRSRSSIYVCVHERERDGKVRYIDETCVSIKIKDSR